MIVHQYKKQEEIFSYKIKRLQHSIFSLICFLMCQTKMFHRFQNIMIFEKKKVKKCEVVLEFSLKMFSIIL